MYVNDLNKKETIPNWRLWESIATQIHIIENFNEQGYNEEYYAALYFVFDSEDNSDYNVTILTDFYHKDPIKLAKLIFAHVGMLFTNISHTIAIIHGEDGSDIEHFDLSTEKFVSKKMVN